ncbi:MAG: M20/M25/M40 family metallo-hydrolase, partial [Collinsella sp.]
MDALPIAETTGAAFASTHPGKMHACGHDGHMAMALAAATFVDRTIREQPGVIKRNVLFVFQPAEETTGGAKTVCESGVFERYGVDRIFGFHVWPDLPAGTLASCPGPLLARSSETHIHI